MTSLEEDSLLGNEDGSLDAGKEDSLEEGSLVALLEEGTLLLVDALLEVDEAVNSELVAEEISGDGAAQEKSKHVRRIIHRRIFIGSLWGRDKESTTFIFIK